MISSHLLSLLEEICTHVLILHTGKMVAGGTLAEIVTRFAGPEGTEAGKVDLEEVFFRATGVG